MLKSLYNPSKNEKEITILMQNYAESIELIQVKGMLSNKILLCRSNLSAIMDKNSQFQVNF